ncbi:MAG: endonuclease domain-containing protein [Bacteroidaceae bacterium]|jgi:very-short-patch-repair endonuclease|nr:endonuclease domain-containing protein [Bacteroidaceae bacterium]
MKRPNNIKEQTTQRQELRNKGTAAEATLWHGLKGRQIEGMRWRRQFGVGPYILDFYCPQLHLCIELDGAQHYTIQGEENDLQREEWLLQVHGIRTIRFENKDIFNNYDGVIENIREVTKEILGSAKLFQTPSASLR